MSAERVEYHQGAIADVKSAVAWYQKRSPKAALDFIEELHRAAETMGEGSGTLAARKERHQTIPALAIPVCHHLFRARIRRHNLGRCPRQQTTGVLGTSALNQKEPPPTMVTFQSVA
jgi:plasmid stabilization system protein ParE